MKPMKRALLVEDDVATRALIARQLRQSGLEVLAVESGERVLSEAPGRYASFDVVILDVHLPGMSGLDLASLIQARRPDQPMVLITGDADPRLAREALSRGPVRYLLKPFEMSQLLAAVEQALARPAGQAGHAGTAGAGGTSNGWLDLVERSYMGSVHARRVGRVALALAEAVQGVGTRLDIGDLLVAAWSHEVGRTRADGDAIAVACEGARMLSELGSSPNVVKAVRHLAERHDGQGGPDGLAGDDIPLISQMVAVADALEHHAAASLAEEAHAVAAADAALARIATQRGTVFRHEVVDAAHRQRARLITICADATGVERESRTAAVA